MISAILWLPKDGGGSEPLTRFGQILSKKNIVLDLTWFARNGLQGTLMLGSICSRLEKKLKNICCGRLIQVLSLFGGIIRLAKVRQLIKVLNLLRALSS